MYYAQTMCELQNFYGRTTDKNTATTLLFMIIITVQYATLRWPLP